MKGIKWLVMVMCMFTISMMMGQNAKQGKLVEKFKAADTNADTKLDLEEFKAYRMAHGKKEISAEKLTKQFDKVDANKDGFLDADEFKAIAKRRKKNAGKEGSLRQLEE